MKKTQSFITSIVAISSFLLGVFVTSNFGIYKSKNFRLQILNELFETLENDWYYGDDETLDKMLERILGAVYDYNVDPYTYLVSSKIEEDSSSNKPQYGIGVTLVRNFDITDNNLNNPKLNELGLLVMDVYENSPSYDAGIQKKDYLVGVYESDTYIPFEGLTYDLVRPYILGDLNETTTFKIKRDDTFIDLDVTRKSYKANSVSLTNDFKLTYPNQEVLRIEEFKESTGGEVGGKLKTIENPQAKDLVIDLRDNPGGYVFSMANVASYFLPSNLPVLVYEDKNGEKYIAERTSGFTKYEFNSITVLINGNSASASEALTLCLRYYKKYLNNFQIVGEKSYGKGIAQTSYGLSNGATLNYTFAKVYDPSGDFSIHKEGIVPDVEIKFPSYERGNGLSYYQSYYGQLEGALIEAKKLGN